MSKATIQPGQTLIDIAVQHLGSEEGVFALAQLNELSITDELTAGNELELPEVVDKRVTRYFTDGGYRPSVGVDIDILEGIGYWGVFTEFEVV